jgi:hypothetical protein
LVAVQAGATIGDLAGNIWQNKEGEIDGFDFHGRKLLACATPQLYQQVSRN